MRILGAAIDFGWGPAGKLASVIRSLADASWYIYQNSIDTTIFGDFPISGFYSGHSPEALERFCQETKIDAAVVVLEPTLARQLEAIGVPTVYIDSLPFLWTEQDEIPSEVSLYCAQQCGALPEHCWNKIRGIKNLNWVEPIVPAASLVVPKNRENHAVINLGGLHWTTPNKSSYARLVIPPAIRVLLDAGIDNITVTGSSAAIEAACDVEVPAKGGVCFRAMAHEQFLMLVAKSRLLLSSPGLTTMYETSGLQVPTVALPPQNLSQYRNAQFFRAYTSGEIVDWQSPALEWSVVEAQLKRGEEFVVHYIQSQIDILSRSSTANDRIERRLRSVLDNTKLSSSFTSNFQSLFGKSGAAQVARHVQKLAQGDLYANT